MAIVTTSSRQPTRITITCDSVPSVVAANWTLTRKDLGHSEITVAAAWLVGITTVELALSGPMIAGLVYIIAGESSTVTVGYRQPAAPPLPPAVGEDPEAEALGRDLRWITAAGLDLTGNVPGVSGRACVTHDLEAIAVTDQGELFHRPNDGGNLGKYVNASGGPARRSKVGGELKRQWSLDRRLRSVSVAVSEDGSGQVIASGTATLVATAEELLIRPSTR